MFRVAAPELGDYPRGLDVEAERGGVVVAVSRASYMRAFGAAMARAPEDIRVRLPLTPAAADALRFRQTGHSVGPWWWSIDDLALER